MAGPREGEPGAPLSARDDRPRGHALVGPWPGLSRLSLAVPLLAARPPSPSPATVRSLQSLHCQIHHPSPLSVASVPSALSARATPPRRRYFVQMPTAPPDHRKSSMRAPGSAVNMAATQSAKAKTAVKSSNGNAKAKTQMHRRSRTGTLARLPLTRSHLHALCLCVGGPRPSRSFVFQWPRIPLTTRFCALQAALPAD